MKQKPTPYVRPYLNIGSASFLLVFLTLCLVTFAVLSVSTARSDYSMARQAADRKEAYYQALNRSEEKLALLDEKLSGCFESCASFGDYLSSLYAGLPEAGFTLTEEDGRVLASFTEDMTDRQELFVSVLLTDPYESGETVFYRLVSRKTNTKTKWEGDDTVTLMEF